jgi:hypothetical protein
MPLRAGKENRQQLTTPLQISNILSAMVTSEPLHGKVFSPFPIFYYLAFQSFDYEHI